MKRLQHIDALRGFALFGILLLHAHGNFGINAEAAMEILPNPKLNSLASQFITFLVSNKAFAMFSIMFGFGFYLQLYKGSFSGSNFTRIYTWRLFILLVFGYIHSMYFRSDILTKYALIGFVMLLLHKLRPRYILLLAFLLLLQIPEIIQLIKSLRIPDYQITPNANPLLWERLSEISESGSFAELVKLNMGAVFIEMWKLNFSRGRIFTILGYFLLGYFLGRSCLLDNPVRCRKYYYYILGVGVVMYILIRYIRSYADNSSGFSEQNITFIISLLSGYMNFFMVAIIFSMFVILYQVHILKIFMDILGPYGRMSLTSYMAQSFLGVFVFYGFGLGMYDYLGSFLSLFVGVIILLMLLVFSHIWFRYYRYGPLEWVWRALTNRTWDVPMRKE